MKTLFCSKDEKLDCIKLAFKLYIFALTKKILNVSSYYVDTFMFRVITNRIQKFHFNEFHFEMNPNQL